MESKEQSGGRVSVKESIKYICELLAGLGVAGIAPENLRLAKFNKLESHRCLLHALHDIVILSFPVTTRSSATPNSRKGPQLGKRASIVAALDPVWDESPDRAPDEEMLGFVKFQLAFSGYPPHSPFFKLHVDAHDSSRHFLLALGWIISHCKLIERGLERRLQPLLAARSAAPLPDEYPLDMASSPEALGRAREAEYAAQDYVRRMVAATDRVDDEVLRTEMRADQALILHGQVRACLNAIEALQQTKVKKLHELQLAQLAAGVKHLHTPYELHLLQHRKKLDLHCQAIAAAKAIEDEKEACRKHEDLFWQWMESVAQEELAQSSPLRIQPPTTIDLTGVTEAELLPAIQHLKHTLATSERDITNHETSSQDPEMPTQTLSTLSQSFKRNVSIGDADPMLPQHGKEITDVLLRPPIFVYRPEKRLDHTRTIKATLRNEEENDPHTALFKIKRLMEVDEMVRGILARTRAENKAVIMEIMKPIMEDESYVIVGL